MIGGFIRTYRQTDLIMSPSGQTDRWRHYVLNVSDSPSVRLSYVCLLLYLETCYFDKNLAIANRSRVSCAHNPSKASIITPDLEI